MKLFLVILTAFFGAICYAQSSTIPIVSASKGGLPTPNFKILSDEELKEAIDELMAQPQHSNVKDDTDTKNEVPDLVDKSSGAEQVAEPEYESYDKR